MEDKIGMTVTLPEYRALVLLTEHGELAPFELADALEVTRPAVTRIIRRLSHRRLIKRRRDSDDRRQARLQLSQRGRSIVEAVTRERARRLRPAIRDLSDWEQGTLLDVLWRIHRSLEPGPKSHSS
jgi:DNA-binding MarR family transcriptional regulator